MSIKWYCTTKELRGIYITITYWSSLTTVANAKVHGRGWSASGDTEVSYMIK